MKAVSTMAFLILPLALLSTIPATAADDSKLKEATRQVESGAKTAGEGIADTAKGVGNTAIEGAKAAGEKMKEAGKAAEPRAKNGWDQLKDSASSFGQSVKNFFTRLFGK